MNLFRRKPAPADIEVAERSFIEGKSQVQSAPGNVLFDESLGVYQRWYFEFRLKEEVARATRYSATFAILVILVEPPGDMAEEARQALMRHVADAITKSLRATDLIASPDPGVFAVCLIQCDQRTAEVAAQRVEEALVDVPHATAGTLFPQDNLGPDELLTLARRRASNSGAYTPTYSEEVRMPPWNSR